MAPLPVIGDTFRCALTIRRGLTGQYAVNIFHVRSDTLNEEQIGTALVGLLKNSNSPYRSCMANGAIMDLLTITPLDGSSASGLFPMGTDGVGLISSDAVPNAPAILSLRTPLRGPANRGRQYLPFIAESIMADGQIDTTALGTANSKLTTWRGQVATAGMELVVASYTHSEANIVTSAAIEQQLGTQRRRQDRIRRSA